MHSGVIIIIAIPVVKMIFGFVWAGCRNNLPNKPRQRIAGQVGRLSALPKDVPSTVPMTLNSHHREHEGHEEKLDTD